MAERVRFGVIGTSNFAELLHINQLKTHTQVELAAICGRDQERAGAMAQKHGFQRVFADYRQMIERGELDAVAVVTPDDLHHPMTMHALEHGLHVLCEKPLAVTATDARQMYETAERKGVKHMTNFTWRALPTYRHIASLVGEGYVGRPYALSAEYLAGGSRNAQYRWRYDASRANGVLGDLGSHMIDLARWFCGEIGEVQASLPVFASRPNAEGTGPLARPANDEAHLLLRFASGAQGSIRVSNVTLRKGQIQRVALHGQAGALEAEFDMAGSAWPLRGGRHADGATVPLDLPDSLLTGVDRASPMLDQLRAILSAHEVGPRLFVECVLRDRPVEPSFREGWRAQQVIDAALESDRTGRRVAVGA